jgi:hypothetical protein
VVKVAALTAPLVIVFGVISNAPFLTQRKFGGHVIGRDFLNYWSGSKLLLSGHLSTLYDPAAYSAWLVKGWGAGFGALSFSYPPTLLPFISWLGVFPYGVALALWSLLGVGLLIAAGWPYTKRPSILLALLAAPAVFVCLDDGQNGLIFSAVLAAALRLVDRKPVLAGVLIGLLTVKPQLGILIPIALLCAGRWKTIGAAAVTTVALVALSVAIVGVEPWRLYIEKVVPFQSLLFRGTGMWQYMTPSPTIAVVVAGGTWPLAWAVQAVVSLAMVALTIAVFLGRGRGREIGAVDRVILIAATFLATPYGFNYDMPSLALCLLLAGVTRRPDVETTAAGRWGIVLLWTTPIVMVIVALSGVNGALALALGLGLFVWATRQDLFATDQAPAWLARWLTASPAGPRAP